MNAKASSLSFNKKDIISIDDLSKTEILHILTLAQQLKKQPSPSVLSGKIMASCFFEPSTRTRISFETAMLRLGGNVTGFATGDTSSAKKGESLQDTIKIMGQYADIIVIRHPLEGSARVASEATDIPIINGGDGANQHPTQTLLDLMTIRECQHKLQGLNIALAGDLKYGRTVHSLALASALFNIRLYFISPPALEMPDWICKILRSKRVKFSFHNSIEEVIPKADILYMTRLQKERFSDSLEFERTVSSYILKNSMLKNAKKNLRILHPLPRIDEIKNEMDETPYAYYFQQAQNGLYIRQALLGLVLGKL